jgi:hypothetical protein
MDRKEFLKHVCGLGVCGCIPGLAAAADEPSRADEATAPDPRLAFARYQVSKIVGFIAADTSSETAIGILEKTGRECAKLGKLHIKFKNDPEGYFAAAKKNWGTDFSWDKPNNKITVAVAEGPCGCPLVDPARTPALWCNCSVGYQREAFESIFGKAVQASLKESKLTGSKRCVFEIRLT